ncbi:DNA-binding transcriptional MerR regulator [Pseudomonas duriflava]|uniref:DNA-binding transcriptional MerR regulator n=1 Tax=Pseudomonas duriflava TaxID=459528 RepID=A0A562QDY0_9PSED|nr:MerR family transcriptional regulator [Pseudomonas duriflava]TWI54909.1 DNA-binding transcriptional MerR regulator [Pseudomonas duriflava]
MPSNTQIPVKSPVDTEGDGDYQAALNEGWLPIREVARRTGVNAVTLRAWERRYGLILPKRTPKGHRLYGESHIERIQNILAWINRGVAVGQVKALLDTQRPAPLLVDTPWLSVRQEILDAVRQLASRRLDEAYNRAAALYPPRVLCEQLLLPLIEHLDQQRQVPLQGRLEQVFFLSWLRSKLGTRIYHSNHQLNGSPLLLASLSDAPMNVGLWLSAWLLSNADCPVETLEWNLSLDTFPLTIERMTPRALVLYLNEPLDAAQVRQLLGLSNSRAVPLLLAGPAVSLLDDESKANVEVAFDPLDVFNRLQGLGLLTESI